MNISGKEKASVLILSLWMIGLLTIFAVYLGLSVRQKLDFLGRMEMRNKLYYIAEAGIKKAVSEIGNIDNTLTYSVLNNSVFNNEQAFVGITVGEGDFNLIYSYPEGSFSGGGVDPAAKDEFFGVSDVAARLNLNTAQRSQIQSLITEITSLDDHEANIIAASIVDWRDADSQITPNGAEDEYYKGMSDPYLCKDAPFQALEELGYVQGIDKDVFERIQPYITIFGLGRVNINTASGPVLRSLGISKEIVMKILAYRNGSDQVAATGDDQGFTEVGAVVSELGKIYALSVSQVAELNVIISQGAITTFSNIFQVQSIAKLSRKQQFCIIDCVFEKNSLLNVPRAGWVLSWRVNYAN